MAKIKVLVIDDSALIRKVLTEIINSQPDMMVIDTASDPLEARDKIKKLNPDVLTLDVEMPKMDGITFLKNLMRLRPMPVIMVSTLTESGAEITLEALSIGAVDCVAKPSANGNRMDEIQEELVQKIRAAAGASISSIERVCNRHPLKKSDSKQKEYRPRSNYLIAIGASTGGTEAIKEVLIDLPENSAPVVIAQHIPPNFSASYAARMNTLCAVKVHEAQDGQPIEAGHAYIAPGGFHLAVKRSGNGLVCVVNENERVNRHRPSVDVLFHSVATVMKNHATGVLLTGMGNDGAQGLLQLKEAGAYTIIQDKDSSVVWGMPGVAFNLNAHEVMLPLSKIAAKIVNESSRHSQDESRHISHG